MYEAGAPIETATFTVEPLCGEVFIVVFSEKLNVQVPAERPVIVNVCPVLVTLPPVAVAIVPQFTEAAVNVCPYGDAVEPPDDVVQPGSLMTTVVVPLIIVLMVLVLAVMAFSAGVIVVVTGVMVTPWIAGRERVSVCGGAARPLYAIERVVSAVQSDTDDAKFDPHPATPFGYVGVSVIEVDPALIDGPVSEAVRLVCCPPVWYV